LGIYWIDKSISEEVLPATIYDITEQIYGESITRVGTGNKTSDLNYAIQAFTGCLRRKSTDSRILVIVDDIQDPQIAQALSALATPQSV
ncbi:MAG TPA: hypothetical protein PLZ51_26140, partial [Aggregatilineales bacterium]|nr:hypothetical protein [Aggregatilineales bacterium]